MEIRSDTRFLPVALVEEKNMLESGFDFLVLDLICSSVFRAWKWRVGWHLERKERRTRKKIHVLAELKSSSEGSISIKQNQVLWA